MDFRIEDIFEVEADFEFNLSVGGFSYLVIYGKHINGGFCCVPNRRWGCEMARPEDIRYNAEKLMECGAEKNVAEAIAKAIYFISKEVIKKDN